jgi:Protein of unknown function (DUF3800)
MSRSYIAYIDESGDDGLTNFRGKGSQGGASSWLIISACVFRYSYDVECVGWRDEILAEMPEKKSRDLHFTNLTHQQKVFATKRLSEQKVKAISILSNKRTIQPGTYQQKNQLYFYLTRYLIERVSWLCRDYRHIVTGGDGRVKIIFSRRGGMSYQDFQSYLYRLQADQTVTIHWPVIDIDGVEAFDHSTRAGLQLADIVASSFAAGVETDRFGNCECRYAETLKPKVYCRNNNYLSYGVKAVPWFHEMTLTTDQQSPPAHDCVLPPAIQRTALGGSGT